VLDNCLLIVCSQVHLLCSLLYLFLKFILNEIINPIHFKTSFNNVKKLIQCKLNKQFHFNSNVKIQLNLKIWIQLTKFEFGFSLIEL